MPTIDVLDATGATQTIAKVANTGSTTDANSLPVTQSTEDKALRAAANASLSSIDGKTPALVGGAVPVTGSFYQATQPVSIAGSVAVTGSFYQATQPISAVSLPLPSGAATSAKQPALGTAGTPSSDVLSIQGVASGVAIPVSGTFWQATQPVSIAATVNTTDSHTTAGAPLSVRLSDGSAFYTASGGGGGSNAAAGLTGSAVPTSAGYTGYNSGGNLVGVSTSNPLPVAQQGSVAVTGTFWQATQPVSLASSVAVTGTFWQTTQPVSAASLPLPTGAATSANQTTLNTTVASLRTLGTTITSGTITRPANTTAYGAGDVVGATAAALAFASAGASGQTIRVTGLRFMYNVAAVPSGQITWRLHLYSATPPSAYADNAVWDLPSGDRASYLGYIDIPQLVDAGSTLYIQADNINHSVLLAGTAVYGYLVTNGAYTPGSADTFSIVLNTEVV